MTRICKYVLLTILGISSYAQMPAKAQSPLEPGGVEIVVVDGEVRRLSAFGYANIEQRVAMSSDAVFRIASMTKQFTAVAVLALVEDGRLSLDDRLVTRLHECPSAWREITLRQLLSHTSGLSGDFAPLLAEVRSGSTPRHPVAHLRDDFTPRQLLERYADLPLHSAPGEGWAYANLNYWILGLVIEEATGESYADFVQRRVLAPAGLTNTAIGAWEPIIPGRVSGYERSESGEISNARYFSSTIGYSAGGYLSSSGDLARWYTALSHGEIISSELIELALTPARLNDGEVVSFGLGWHVAIVGGRYAGHHGGSSIGFRSYVYWIPETFAVAVTLLNNSGGDEPNMRTRALIESSISLAPY